MKITKTKRIELARKIIDRYKGNENTDFSRIDIDELEKVLLFEQGFITRIQKRINNQFPNDPRHIFISTIENPEFVSISWNNIIRKPCEKEILMTAARNSVMDQIREVRADLIDSAKDASCAKCESKENIAIDHLNPSFKWIFEQFISDYGKPALTANGVLDVFSEPHLSLFSVFHDTHATYQILCRACNSSKGSK